MLMYLLKNTIYIEKWKVTKEGKFFLPTVWLTARIPFQKVVNSKDFISRCVLT